MKKLILILLFPIYCSAQSIPVAQNTFGTLADLRGQVGGVASVQVLLKGLNSINDSNGGTYMWSTTSTSTDDGFTIIRPTSISAGSPGRWLRLTNSNTIKGNVTFSGTLLQTAYVVNHGLPFTPAQVIIQARSNNAAAYSYVSAINSTSFTINFLTVPVIGSANISFDYLVIKQ